MTVCAKADTDAAITHLEELISEDNFSWSLLTQLSVYHAVYPMLYQKLITAKAAHVPEDVLHQFHRVYRNTAAHNLLLVQELKRVNQILAAHEIPLIAFKGPVLAQVAYKNLGLRPCTDIDILIPEDRFSEVETVLIDDGYRVSSGIQSMSKSRKALHLYLSQQAAFMRGRNYSLDVHVRLMPPGYKYNPSFEDLLERSQQVAVAGSMIQSFAPEDLLQILCYHGAKNRWERLKHICDIAELVRANQDMDWDAVIRRTEATRGLRILGLGLYLAHKLLDLKLPDEVLKRVLSDKQVISLGAWVIARLPAQMELGIAGYKERVRLHLRLQDNVIDKARYGLYSLLRQIDD
ncbi:MAG TPA: nucleotidyltransferase family protein [Rhodothermales bacterium]|nr:nucleotidyltransferase family protein [Rhodothermales bacterium]